MAGWKRIPFQVVFVFPRPSRAGRFRHGLGFLLSAGCVRRNFYIPPAPASLGSLPSFTDREGEIVGLPDPALANPVRDEVPRSRRISSSIFITTSVCQQQHPIIRSALAIPSASSCFDPGDVPVLRWKNGWGRVPAAGRGCSRNHFKSIPGVNSVGRGKALSENG